MGTTQLRLVGAGFIFLATFISGYWLSRKGKPYSGIMLTIHKLVVLRLSVVFKTSILSSPAGAYRSTVPSPSRGVRAAENLPLRPAQDRLRYALSRTRDDFQPRKCHQHSRGALPTN